MNRKCQQRVNHSMIHSPSRFSHRLGGMRGPKGPNLLADGFASIAFGYPNANLGLSPNPVVLPQACKLLLKNERQPTKKTSYLACIVKSTFWTLKIEYSARSVRSTEREREMLAPGWPLWPERFHNDPREIPSATGISPPGPFEW